DTVMYPHIEAARRLVASGAVVAAARAGLAATGEGAQTAGAPPSPVR
ncbi:MAG: hypothetical protein HGA45_33225, partial [Chloroflexales bacterium]|nr:hypothetical protein [Chloroflexales bacterium]